MLDVMFDLPSREDIEKCVITGKTVTDGEPPRLIMKDGTVVNKDKNFSIMQRTSWPKGGSFASGNRRHPGAE